MLTYIKDLDHEIMMKIDDLSLLNFCRINNKYVQKLCNDENFWMKRTNKHFSKIIKLPNRSWKELYLKIVHYKKKYSIFEAASKLDRDKEYDIYSYFEKLAIDRIRRVMVLELRMDSDRDGIPYLEQDQIILQNKNNIDKSAHVMYTEFLIGRALGELDREAIFRSYHNMYDDKVYIFRNYLYKYLEK